MSLNSCLRCRIFVGADEKFRGKLRGDYPKNGAHTIQD